MKALKALGIAIGFLAGLVVVVLAIGWTMPADHSATVSMSIAQTPDAIWDVITDFEHQDWRPGFTKADRLEDREGHPVWRESFHDGKAHISHETVEMLPPRRLVRKVGYEDGAFDGLWTITIEPTDGGSVVTITEKSHVMSPLGRFVLRYVIGDKLVIDTYLKALVTKLGAGPDTSPA